MEMFKVRVAPNTVMWQYMFRTQECQDLTTRCSHFSLRGSWDTVQGMMLTGAKVTSFLSASQFSSKLGRSHRQGATPPCPKIKSQSYHPSPLSTEINRVPSHTWDDRLFCACLSLIVSHITHILTTPPLSWLCGAIHSKFSSLIFASPAPFQPYFLVLPFPHP